jgi:nitroimidazol reductase NimA-like FMN-containing flavoprotein (pyridoxamine 5'-phosphate oxidase superfamily)
MLIREMTMQQNAAVLARTRLGRLACTHDGQPYIVPFYFAYDGSSFYSFATVGQKIEWMRLNPKVCIQVDEIVAVDRWFSVIVVGLYEELYDEPELQDIREHAHRLLQTNASWWETAVRAPARQCPLAPLYYRINALQITGRAAEPKP